MTTFKKFKLIGRTKNPTTDFAKDPKYRNIRNVSDDEIKKSNCNWGVACGSISNLTVVDLDCAKDNFDFPFDYLNIDTRIVKSPNDGYHIYFQYEADLYTVQKSKVNVDIRNTGGYVVDVNAIIYTKKKEWKPYTLYKDRPVAIMPADMKQWLLKNVCNNKQKQKQNTKQQSKKLESKITACIYNYDIPKKIIPSLLQSIDPKYWDSYDDFLKYTTACKVLGCFDEWDEINKTKREYDYNKNVKIWNACHTIEHLVDIVFANCLYIIDYYRYKPILNNTIIPDETINKNKLGYDFFDDKNNYVIRSDTGTGKTTSFKHYASKNNIKFISITSRITLAQEQYYVFSNHHICCNLYNIAPYIDDMSYVTTIDSIVKLPYDEDFSDTVLFLDEFASIIDYLITSDTLNNNRIIVYNFIQMMIKKCKQIICVDGDINDVSLKFLNYCKIKYKFIHNEYKHNKDVKAFEIDNYESIREQLKTEDKFMVATDSIHIANLIKKDLDDENIKVITSETKDYVNLDDHDKVIFSPKIIYGLDSSMHRNVYAIYREQSINPCHFLQQISRCRNIKNLYYYFNKKKFNHNTQTLDDVIEELNNCKTTYNNLFAIVGQNDKQLQYMDLLSIITYNNNCYNTNKYAWFIKLLNHKGFIICEGHNKVNKINKYLKEYKEYKYDSFDPNAEHVKNLNKYFQIPDDELNNFKEIFLDSHKKNEHFRFINYENLSSELLHEKINNTRDYEVNKLKTLDAKLYLLLQFQTKYNIKFTNGLMSYDTVDEKTANDLNKYYNDAFRNRSKKILYGNEQFYFKKFYNSLFTDYIKKPNKNSGKLIINKDYTDYHHKLLSFRQTQTDLFLDDDE